MIGVPSNDSHLIYNRGGIRRHKEGVIIYKPDGIRITVNHHRVLALPGQCRRMALYFQGQSKPFIQIHLVVNILQKLFDRRQGDASLRAS